MKPDPTELPEDPVHAAFESVAEEVMAAAGFLLVSINEMVDEGAENVAGSSHVTQPSMFLRVPPLLTMFPRTVLM